VKVGMFECDPPSLSLGRLAGLWRVIRMCEGSFERRSARAGVLGKTAPAVAGRRRALGCVGRVPAPRSCGTRLRVDFGLGKANRAGVG